jgi:hypothetical protein
MAIKKLAAVREDSTEDGVGTKEAKEELSRVLDKWELFITGAS